MKGIKAGDYDKAYKQIGKRLRELRKKAGYTSSSDFAYEIDMVPSQYAAYERGTNLKIDTLITILHKLNCSLGQFFSEGID